MTEASLITGVNGHPGNNLLRHLLHDDRCCLRYLTPSRQQIKVDTQFYINWLDIKDVATGCYAG